MMIDFNEKEFYSYVDRLSNSELLKETISLRDMLGVRYLTNSPLVDILGDMEGIYLNESFVRFACAVDRGLIPDCLFG
ncbi:hypothetical protein [Hungatella sp. SL.1.14]|jgi:hypothetical protein|uniref:hypothetical protein n=1 Tax=unclassified Hungatella TaxID=2613923 RepID=UPI00210A0771|nr:hypothetical protein [Hungatella sp. SL.1.14]MCQ4830132.1 hypothetical protein [Hungatella sp. SL.1.14]